MKTTTAPVQRRGQSDAPPAGRFRLGGLAFGGHYGLGSARMARQVLEEALEAGVRCFDTSPLFGAGKAETLLSEVLGSETRNVSIASKAALPDGNSPTSPFRVSRDALLPCLEGTLTRLKGDHVDLYYYDVSTLTGELSAIIEGMIEVREAGLIRNIGLITARTDVLKQVSRYGKIDSVLVPYNIFNRPADTEFLPFCRISGIGVHACEPLCRGLLAGALHRNSVFEEGDVRIMDRRFRGSRFRENIETAERLRYFAAGEGLSLLELAIGWVLQHPSIAEVVCGAKTPEQLHRVMAATSTRLKLDQILEIDLIAGDRKDQSAEH